ncbi:right-handed parallel beta-helix repeat-containing protein [Mycoplana rhizolycopersici]|uniref:Right-handed parallel beta-helix repeat-containing protein n=1 Tax=Mycoplana rhizolycopersici TaxID=2746702 RepID=A0ABX2QGD5_9HYPH|nr:right-handed parallel beta-helix repeat-containing protein [Rhizobium rhizolycopersici]NVP56830.1 right-handed parallel beta-helix repeat-containing protein [Rhizobium rhizolycopersici]
MNTSFIPAMLGAGLLLAGTAAASPFPDARNTGVKTDTSLKPYAGTLYISDDGTVVEGLEITGSVVVDAKNVTIRNSRIIADTPWHIVYIKEGVEGFTLEDSEIDGRGKAANGALGRGTFLRNNIHGVENGLNIDGPSLIQGNFIHDMRGGPEAHFDGIEINGGKSIQILENTVLNENGQTAAIMLNNYFRGLADITVDGNRLAGGGYTIYLDGRFKGGPVDAASIRITRNVMSRGQWGFFALYGNRPVQSDNTIEATGAPIAGK